MRPVMIFFLLLGSLLLLDIGLLQYGRLVTQNQQKYENVLAIHVNALGLTDLAVSTEARYTRHPAVSDPIAPFMDHPGALEHFPSGTFWEPPSFH